MFKKIISTALILLFFVVSFNRVSNWHTHFINGVSIKHSHPFDTKHKHSHTKKEFQLINLIDSSFIEDSSNAEIPIILSSHFSQIESSDYKTITHRFSLTSNKSPPIS